MRQEEPATPPDRDPADRSAPGEPFWPLAARAVADLVGGRLAGDPEARLERIAVDSRAALAPGDLFVGLAGPHFDGGRFAEAALADGATAALVSAAWAEIPLAGGRALITVADPLAALQALAAEARRRFAGVVVAVTGSNGKTAVKDLLAHALAAERRVWASPLSYNSQVGVALALLGLDPEAEVAIVECGISQPGEMDRLEAMVRPDAGILTTVGDAHLAGLGDRQTTAREKARLFRRVAPPGEGRKGGWVITGAGETLARAALGAHEARVLTVGAAGDATAEFRLAPGSGGEGFVLSAHAAELDAGLVVRLPFSATPPHQVANAALATAAALELAADGAGASPRSIEAGLARWHPAPMRLEIGRTPRGLLLINDAYTSDPVSLEAALRALEAERGGEGGRRGRAVVVLGGMAQLGAARSQAHQAAGRRLAEMEVDLLVTVGPGGREIAAAARAAGLDAERVHEADDADEAAWLLDERCRPGDRVLLKGSRPEGLERVASELFGSVAPARLTVDLDALVDNFHAVRRAAGRRRGQEDRPCGVMAVVKSFGYGLDAVRLARALEHAGADAFAVAYPDEGVELRDHGITAPILVQHLLAREVDKVVRHGLSAQIASADQIGPLAAEAERQRRSVRVHLKVDTGMGRAGAAPAEAVELARAVEASGWLKLDGLMTHFAAADDPAADDFTRGQIGRFEEAIAALGRAGFEPPWIHAAASAGVARFPEAAFTMVRAGIGLLGYQSIPSRDEAAAARLPQRPVLRLTTRVVSVKELPPGHPVGYGRTYTVGPRPAPVAVVAVGYGDGYPRALSNKGWMTLAGVRCPVVGRVSMDVTTLDLTPLAGRGEAARPGDEVVVFGPGAEEPSLAELAELAGTIPYEILTRLSPRIRREFWSSR